MWWDGQGQPDWAAWHDDYDRPGSSLAIRLAIVQDLLRRALDCAPVGPIRMISMCAGQGRDILEVLPLHPRGIDVTARLVELDASNVAYARSRAVKDGLHQVEIVQGDASITNAYVGAVPANIVVVCGVFGNLSNHDVQATIQRLPEFCSPGAAVIWTRHRREPDLTPHILEWFELAGFELVQVEAPADTNWVGVGVHRLVGTPRPFVAHEQIFEFVREATDTSQ